MLLGLKASIAGGVMNVVAEFTVDVAGVEG
jgi:hypothetical protein